jgi:high frequency lysogenization protein
LEIARYVFYLFYLENKLTKRPDLMNIIKTGINRANTQVNLFSLTHDNVMANLAGIYIDTLSTFTFRIHVTGSQCYLANHGIANKTRALLLAGVRSAVLWKQIGGSRLQLFFKKNTFLNCAKHLYNSSTIEQS